ncbi:MAG: hypothetical protein ABIM30_06770 [candidate division WOR-3 bacterium]
MNCQEALLNLFPINLQDEVKTNLEKFLQLEYLHPDLTKLYYRDKTPHIRYMKDYFPLEGNKKTSIWGYKNYIVVKELMLCLDNSD